MVKELLSDVIGESAYLMKKDLEHMTDEQVADKPSEGSRSVLELVNECSGFMEGITAVVKGADAFPAPDESFVQPSNKSEAIARLDGVVGNLIEAVMASDESHLATKITTPWGQELTRAKLAYWAASHNMYHDGQICYYQILKGDREMHWV